MPQLNHLGRAHTRVIFMDENRVPRSTLRLGSPDECHITYHARHIVCFNNNFIALRHNGYLTMTTRTRMNQAANQFGLGYLVYQRTIHGRKKWYVSWCGMQLPFTSDGIILNRPSPLEHPRNPTRPPRSRRAPRVTELTPQVGRPLNTR